MKLTDLQRLVVAARTVLPDAIVSGGAPRDLIHGRPVKDIDLMTGRPLDSLLLGRLARAVGGTLASVQPLDPSGDAEFEHEIMLDGLPPLNVIDLSGFEITDPIDNLHDFDFGLSQVAVTPHGVVQTDAFRSDSIGGTVTYMGDRGREDWRIASSAKRLRRLEAKYPYRLFKHCFTLRERKEYRAA